MTRIYSFALGNIWRWAQSENRNGLLRYAKNLDLSGVEITLPTESELCAFRLSKENLSWLKTLPYVTIHAPFDPCAIPPTIFPKLKGLSLNKGWKKGVAEVMGATKGCTHLRELLNILATVCYQTVAGSPEYFAKMDRGEVQPFYIGSCQAYDESGPVIERLYPDYYKPRPAKTR